MVLSTFSILIAVVTALIVFAVSIRYRGWRLATTMSLIALAAVACMFRDSRQRRKIRAVQSTQATRPPGLLQLAGNVPAQEPADGYVSSQACVECHTSQYDTWHASYHRTMTQRAIPGAVLGDFADKHVELDGATYDLSRRGDEFWVKVTLPATGQALPQVIERPIVLTTGSHHMQVYWIPTGSGRTLAELPIFFLLEDQRWISRDASFLKLRDPDPNSPGIGRWNAECIQCHATHGRARPNPDSKDNSSDSLVAEFGIACEACHGPGEQHVRARRGESVEDKIVNPAGLSSQRSSQVCGRCHSITILRSRSDRADWLEHGYRFRPGDALADSLHVLRLDQATRDLLKANILPNDKYVDRAYDMQFWRDGVVRVAGREFNGLVETACYQKGEMACVSCHVMHKPAGDPRPVAEWANDQLKAEALGDTACTQCHSSENYATDGHTHHLASSSGGRCYNCHMPHTTYGLLKAIRSHTIDIPSAAASAKVGRPNACNLCHLDQTLAWTARHLEQWYSIAAPVLDEDQTNISAAVLWALQGDAGKRSLAAWHLGWEPAVEISGNHWQAPFLAALLDDPYLAVRFIARRSLRKSPGFEDFQFDFLGPVAQVDAAFGQALQVWRDSLSTQNLSRPHGRAPAPLRFTERVLLSPDGTLDQTIFDRLKSERDDNPVSLAE
ncbi:MAG: C cytochrome precursor [Planctomycetaceae bacterium]|nr:C cytochrome precursor [Planctomycetaceae bacterium]